jgi:hypothetical protein
MLALKKKRKVTCLLHVRVIIGGVFLTSFLLFLSLPYHGGRARVHLQQMYEGAVGRTPHPSVAVLGGFKERGSRHSCGALGGGGGVATART